MAANNTSRLFRAIKDYDDAKADETLIEFGVINEVADASIPMEIIRELLESPNIHITQPDIFAHLYAVEDEEIKRRAIERRELGIDTWNKNEMPFMAVYHVISKNPFTMNTPIHSETLYYHLMPILQRRTTDDIQRMMRMLINEMYHDSRQYSTTSVDNMRFIKSKHVPKFVAVGWAYTGQNPFYPSLSPDEFMNILVPEESNQMPLNVVKEIKSYYGDMNETIFNRLSEKKVRDITDESLYHLIYYMTYVEYQKIQKAMNSAMRGGKKHRPAAKRARTQRRRKQIRRAKTERKRV